MNDKISELLIKGLERKTQMSSEIVEIIIEKDSTVNSFNKEKREQCRVEIQKLLHRWLEEAYNRKERPPEMNKT